MQDASSKFTGWSSCRTGAEIILNRVSQLTGGSTLIPPLPKNYDVEKRRHYSAGRLRPTKKPKKNKARPAATTTLADEDATEEPSP